MGAKSMSLREDAAALNRIPIQAVGGFLGLQLPRTGMARCPFPDHDDRTPSFHVKKSGTLWICYGCQRRGGSIDFAKVYLAIDFLHAKRWLAEHANFNITLGHAPRRQTKPTHLAAPSPAAKEATEPPPDTALYEDFLCHAPLQTSGTEYLLKRGILQHTISAFRIGQVPNDANFAGDIISKFGFSRVQAAGLLTKNSQDGNWRFLFPPQSILFPFLENDQIVYLQARSLTASASKGKWRNLNHRRRRIYNIDAILEPERASFAICEGVMDALSATVLRYRAIGLIGVSMRLEEKQIRQMRGKQIDILLDWDTAGETRSIELQNELRSFGIASTRKSCPSPGVKDLNDYLVKMKAQT